MNNILSLSLSLYFPIFSLSHEIPWLFHFDDECRRSFWLSNLSPPPPLSLLFFLKTTLVIRKFLSFFLSLFLFFILKIVFFLLFLLFHFPFLPAEERFFTYFREYLSEPTFLMILFRSSLLGMFFLFLFHFWGFKRMPNIKLW